MIDAPIRLKSTRPTYHRAGLNLASASWLVLAARQLSTEQALRLAADDVILFELGMPRLNGEPDWTPMPVEIRAHAKAMLELPAFLTGLVALGESPDDSQVRALVSELTTDGQQDALEAALSRLAGDHENTEPAPAGEVAAGADVPQDPAATAAVVDQSETGAQSTSAPQGDVGSAGDVPSQAGAPAASDQKAAEGSAADDPVDDETSSKAKAKGRPKADEGDGAAE